MNKRIDLTGQRFGRLLVLHSAPSKGKYNSTYWKCRCDCGNEKIILTRSLTHNKVKSCGCLRTEKLRERATHGMSETRFYGIWMGIKNRCNNINEPAYKYYGARGIRVCDRWLESFENFRDDMYQSYSNHIKKFGKDNTTIERKENNGNYCSKNCEWSDKKKQCNNRRSNRLITYKGKTQNISQWAKEVNVSRYNIAFRLKMKWSMDKVFNNKNYNSCRISYKGKTLSMTDLSKEVNIPYKTLYNRIKYLKMSTEKALATPVRKRKF